LEFQIVRSFFAFCASCGHCLIRGIREIRG
jgi:hypothetical protein